MVRDEKLSEDFRLIVNSIYPSTGILLQQCHVKVITSYWGKPPKRLQYIGIYSPEETLPMMQTHKSILRRAAQQIGLKDVVCLNATRLLRDPMSQLQQVDPWLWLELHWLISPSDSLR